MKGRYTLGVDSLSFVCHLYSPSIDDDLLRRSNRTENVLLNVLNCYRYTASVLGLCCMIKVLGVIFLMLSFQEDDFYFHISGILKTFLINAFFVLKNSSLISQFNILIYYFYCASQI